MNPKKCTFGVTSGKLLGHIVSERGIEVDLEKIRAILDMPTLRTEREIRGFLNRLQYISRFIARLIDICAWKKISLISDISVLRFYGYIGYIGDISADILEKNIDRLKIVKNS